MKKILGLDLGTNSIGWALVTTDDNAKIQNIEGMGSRIIPMGADKISYEKGESITKNSKRREKRTARKNNKRYKQRRDKLLYVLNELEMLPEQFHVQHKVKSDLEEGFPDSGKLQDLVLGRIPKKTLQLTGLAHYQQRVNALTERVDLKILGKILYQFNQLRGYAGGGNDNDEKKGRNTDLEDEENKKYEVFKSKCLILSCEDSGETFKGKKGETKGKNLPIWNVNVRIDSGKEYQGTTQLQNIEIDKEIELEIRIKRTKKGENVTFALPAKTNWRVQMEKTEELIQVRQKEKGSYYISELILDDLKQNPWTKIRNRVVLRNRFQEEFDAIWETQSKYHSVLANCPQDKLNAIVCYLYPGKSESQEKYRKDALEKGLKHIIRNHIIYYQRPLKSQTHLISNCSYEKEEKVVAISNPIFQEYRCWQQINNLFVRSKNEVYNERKQKNVLKYQDRYLTNEQKILIYERLQNQKTLGFGEIAKIINLKNDKTEYLNGLHVKAKFVGCDTAITIQKLLSNVGFENSNNELIYEIWNVLYYKTGNEYDPNSEKVSALINLFEKQNCSYEKAESIALELAKKITYPRKYAKLSEKAIQKIVPLMRVGKYFDYKQLDKSIIEKEKQFQQILETGEIVAGVEFEDYIIDYISNNPDALQNGGLMYAHATALVYGTHTQEKVKPTIKDYHDIVYHPNRNLRNPVVEQLVNETMQVIKALWKNYKLKPEDLEIRVELARELKNSAAERDKIYKGQQKNKKINDYVKQRLLELKQELSDQNIEKYKLWGQQSIEEQPKYKDEKNPTSEEVERMRLWEEQKHLSPYTKVPIPLSKLFTKEYEVDHIIPKSRYFDDSLTNKVVCESFINDEKSNRTAWEYISQASSRYNILSIDDFNDFVNNYFYGKKKSNLLAEKIPNNPILRKIKETQYISIAVRQELAKIVGSDSVKTTTGEITSFLRSRWGLKKMFMELTEARFKQMELWDSSKPWVRRYVDKDNKNRYEIENWSKRYDHRHHAVDALVVALTSQSMIQSLNNLNKEMQDWLENNKDIHHLQPKDGETYLEAFFNLNENERVKIQEKMPSFRNIENPLSELHKQVRDLLESIIVSQKPKNALSVQKYTDSRTGQVHNRLKIRGALHEETYYGKNGNRDTKTVSLSAISSADVDKIIDEKLKIEIKNHRNKSDENKKEKYGSYKEAFSGEGLIEFNEDRKSPVYKVRVKYNKKDNTESKLQPLYENKNKNQKLSVVTGNNYLFAVMEKENGKRCFDLISLFDATKIAKENLNDNISIIDEISNYLCNKNEAKRTLFTLQQNDLVYCPFDDDDAVIQMSKDELKSCLEAIENKKEFAQHLYKVVKFTGKDCFFIPNNYANPIKVSKDLTEDEKEELKKKYKDKKIPKTELNYEEFGSFDNSVKHVPAENFVKNLIDKNAKLPLVKIQDVCVKVDLDWLGNIRCLYK